MSIDLLWQIAPWLTAPVALKAFDYLYKAGGEWWKNRRARLAQDKVGADSLAVELAKLDEMKQVNVAHIRRDDFQLIVNSYADVAQSASRRAELSEAALAEFKEKFETFSTEFEWLMEEHKKNETVRFQLEQGIRMLCDTFKIAYWAVTPAGHLEGNYTFFKNLTGLTAEECHHDGWFEAIAEDERATVKELWAEFLRRSETRPQFYFTFVHKHTGVKVRTKVFCLPVMLDGLTVYKFTAQTAPLK